MILTQAREARTETFLQLLAGLWYDYSRLGEGETLGATLDTACCTGRHGALRFVHSLGRKLAKSWPLVVT